MTHEGPLYNIAPHFSTTTIGAILIIAIFQKVKDKKWKTPYEVLAIFSNIILPMLFHSISNQYTNIIYANNNPQFEYLVDIARFFESYSFYAGQYVIVLFVITCILLYIFICPWMLMIKETKKANGD